MTKRFVENEPLWKLCLWKVEYIHENLVLSFIFLSYYNILQKYRHTQSVCWTALNQFVNSFFLLLFLIFSSGIIWTEFGDWSFQLREMVKCYLYDRFLPLDLKQFSIPN